MLNNKFDLDLEVGEIYEKKTRELFTKKFGDNGHILIEVKTDRKTQKTGNLCFEIGYNGYNSGVATSKANYLAYWIMEYDTCIFIPMETVIKIINNPKWKLVQGGDNRASDLVLVNICTFFEELLKCNGGENDGGKKEEMLN